MEKRKMMRKIRELEKRIQQLENTENMKVKRVFGGTCKALGRMEIQKRKQRMENNDVKVTEEPMMLEQQSEVPDRNERYVSIVKVYKESRIGKVDAIDWDSAVQRLEDQ